MQRIILASTSPRRQVLMAELGLPFDIVPSDYEEDMTLPLAPEPLAMTLGAGKAWSVAARYPDALVVGADTLVALGDEVLGKPHTPDRAREMLGRLSGTTHQVITGLCVIDGARSRSVNEVAAAQVHLRALSSEEIEEYIATGEPLDKAGAYAIQGVGRMFVDRVEGEFKGVVGLPVERLRQILQSFGRL